MDKGAPQTVEPTFLRYKLKMLAVGVSGVYAPPMLVCFQRDPVPLFSCEVHLAISWKLVAGQTFVVGGVHDERL